MTGASVAGVATTPFVLEGGAHFEDLAADAVLAAVADAGTDVGRVSALAVGSRFCHPGAGQRLSAVLGGLQVPVYNVENACSSGTTAFALAVRLAACDPEAVVVAVGADVAASVAKGGVALPDDDYAGQAGVTHPAAYALKAQRYLRATNSTIDDLAQVVVNNRANAVRNPHAAHRTPVTAAEVSASPVVADPLTLLHCTANADGAAAAVVVADAHPLAHRTDRRPVRVAAAEHAAGPLADRGASATPLVAQRTFAQAGFGPGDIDVAELYDAFSIAEVLALEDLGFAAPGHGLRVVDELGGARRPAVNTSGGALGRGHPMGATGLAQITEIVTQLRHEAGSRQVPGARRGLVHTLGGNMRILSSNVAAVAAFASP